MSTTLLTVMLIPMHTTVDIHMTSIVPLKELLPYILTASGIPLHPEYGDVRYEYDMSWDGEEWTRLSEEQTLQEQKLLDGMYMRIKKFVSYSSAPHLPPAWPDEQYPLFEM